MRLTLNALDPDTYFDIQDNFTFIPDGSAYRLILSDILTDPARNSYETGHGDDVIIYDLDHAYTSQLLSFSSGGGDDRLYIGRFYIGSVSVSAGAGADIVELAHIEGSSGGFLDAGDGDDTIRVRASLGDGVGIFGNSLFQISAGAGNDRVELEGAQRNLLGAGINIIDGGAGFDSFVWNLGYDLGYGTDQTGVDATNPSNPTEIGIASFEELVLAPAGTDAGLRLTAVDVALITQASDFDRASLGSGFSGTGNVLFLRGNGLPVDLDLTGWSFVATINRAGIAYDLFSAGQALLAVDQAILTATEPPRILWIDTSLGGSILVDELFSVSADLAGYRLVDAGGNEVDYYHWDPVHRAIVIDDWPEGAAALDLRVEAQLAGGGLLSRALHLQGSELSFTAIEATSAFRTVAIGDYNGDGRVELFGTFRQADGSFLSMDPNAHGLGIVFAGDRAYRDHRLADLDNDGDLDLIATTYATSTPGPNLAYLFANDGFGNFTEVPSFTALNVQGFGETIVVADFDNDGLTDFYLPYYFRNDSFGGDDDFAAGAAGLGEDGDDGEVAGSRLFINRGGMGFSDETAAWDVINSDGSLSLKGFGSFFSFMPEGAQALDFNSDGLIDLFAAGHLFLNLGGRFYDAATALGMPTDFEEGALFFDWNNDGYLDFLMIPPNSGPVLYEYNAEPGRFEQAFAFPAGLQYHEVYGVQAGDLNGDGWQDVIVGRGQGVPHIFLNHAGQALIEYRSAATDNFSSYAAPGVADLTGDGQLDFILGETGGILVNAGADPGNMVTITLLGPDGEMNQHGRVVKLDPVDPADTRILTRAVDSGSGYMAQGIYELQFTDSAPHIYWAHAYIIDYATGAPIELTFLASSGHAYVVRAPSGGQVAQVTDNTSGEAVSFSTSFSFAVNQAPIVEVSDEPVVFAGGGHPVRLFDEVSVRDLNSANYAGGWLNIGFVGGGAAGDRLVLLAPGGPGIGIEVAGGLVRFDGRIVGSIIASDTQILIGLNQLADNAAVQALWEAIGYLNDSATPGAQDPVVRVSLTDGGGIANGGSDTVFVERTILFPGGDGPGDGPDTLIGTPGPDELSGLGGNDAISGLGGNDFIDGGPGTDQMAGGGGDDSYIVDDFFDQVIEAPGEGNDSVYAETSYQLGTGQSVETLAARNNGSMAAMNLFGNELNNVIFGNNGANFLDGAEGADILTGFGGDDVYAVDNAGDVVIEENGQGNDAIYTTFSYILGFGSSVELLASRDNSLTTAMNLFGNELNNTILGNNGANYMDGLTGADVMAGYSGDDTYIIDNAGDVVVEEAGRGSDAVYTSLSFVLSAGSSVETIGARDNSLIVALNLTGNELANGLLGNNGANVLDGKGGADTLLGFAGADTFAFTTAIGTGTGNVDLIADFVSGTDKVALDDAIFTGLAPGALAAGAFVTGTAAADADDRIVYDAATGKLYFDADGNGAGAAILFATLQGNPAIAASDFMVI